MATTRTGKNRYPQLPPAPDDYPTFPDKSSWPVVFPELPQRTNGRFARPPQHTSKAAAPWNFGIRDLMRNLAERGLLTESGHVGS